VFRKRTIVAALIVIVLSRAAWAVQEHVVGQKAKTFSVATLKVASGDTLVFKNDDRVTHNIFSAAKGHEFNLQAQPPGASASIQVSGVGDMEVRCAFHPKMKLVVTVMKP
jgi:plastocyanin